MAKQEKPFKVVGWKKKGEKDNSYNKELSPITASENKGKRGKYEEKLSVDLSFEELIKLSVSDLDNNPKK